MRRCFRELQTPITSFAADQEIANAEIKLINPAISGAVASMRTYIGELEDVEGGLEDVETISENVRASLVRQGSAFDDLRRNVDTATSFLSDNAERLEDVDEALKDTADTARREFSTDLENAGRVTQALGQNFADLANNSDVAVGEIVRNLSGLPGAIEGIGLTDVFTSLGTDLGISFAVNLLSTILSELTSGFEDSEFKEQIRNVLQIEAELQIEIADQEAVAESVRNFISGLTGSDLGTDALTSLLGGARAVDPFGLGGATEPLGQAENVIDTFFGTDVDIFGGLRETLETARESLDTEGTDAAFQDFITANNNFYEAVIEALRVIGRDTGQDLQPLIGLISGEQQDTGNQARSGTAEPALGGTSSLSAAYAAAVEAAVSEQEAVEELADFFSFGRDQRDGTCTFRGSGKHSTRCA